MRRTLTSPVSANHSTVDWRTASTTARAASCSGRWAKANPEEALQYVLAPKARFLEFHATIVYLEAIKNDFDGTWARVLESARKGEGASIKYFMEAAAIVDIDRALDLVESLPPGNIHTEAYWSIGEVLFLTDFQRMGDVFDGLKGELAKGQFMEGVHTAVYDQLRVNAKFQGGHEIEYNRSWLPELKTASDLFDDQEFAIRARRMVSYVAFERNLGESFELIRNAGFELDNELIHSLIINRSRTEGVPYSEIETVIHPNPESAKDPELRESVVKGLMQIDPHRVLSDFEAGLGNPDFVFGEADFQSAVESWVYKDSAAAANAIVNIQDPQMHSLAVGALVNVLINSRRDYAGAREWAATVTPDADRAALEGEVGVRQVTSLARDNQILEAWDVVESMPAGPHRDKAQSTVAAHQADALIDERAFSHAREVSQLIEDEGMRDRQLYLVGKSEIYYLLRDGEVEKAKRIAETIKNPQRRAHLEEMIDAR